MARTNLDKENFTLLGSETDFDGVLEFTDKLEIAGKFNGTIKSSGLLTVAKTGICTVDSISIKSIIINGTVSGDIVASDKIEMNAGSSIVGNVSAKRLRISDSVDFDGQVSMLDTKPDVDIFAYTSTDYKELLNSHELHGSD